MTKVARPGPTFAALGFSLCFSLGALCAAEVEYGLLARVTDTRGNVQSVRSLRAEYRVGGAWISGSHSRSESAMEVTVRIPKEHAETKEKFVFHFAEIRRIILESDEIPPAARSSLRGDSRKPARIDLLDGRTLLLGEKALVELDGEGRLIKRTRGAWAGFKSGEAKGESLLLWRFSGRARTSDGKERGFSLRPDEIVSIEFE